MTVDFSTAKIEPTMDGNAVVARVRTDTFTPSRIYKWLANIHSQYPTCCGVIFECSTSQNRFYKAEIAGVRVCKQILDLVDSIEDLTHPTLFQHILRMTFRGR